MLCSSLAILPGWISDNLAWWISGLIVVVGLGGFGWNEIARLRFRRVWAISGVSFSESLRRRVLWVTPLAILAVIAIAQLQHSLDEQETIRQTIKFCLFASGFLVTVTAVILACTNLPREIESRVIYTIVTKPTTRLEIVLGKVLGFIRVSGLIVLIMGVFTFAYLEWRAWRLNKEIAQRLKVEPDPSTQQTLIGYETAGLLSTKSLEPAESLQVYERLPEDGKPQQITGGGEFFFAVPFTLNPQQKALLEGALEDPPRFQFFAITTMRLQRHTPSKEDLQTIKQQHLPLEATTMLGPAANAEQQEAHPVPQIGLRILDPTLSPIADTNDINGGKGFNYQQQSGDTYIFPVPLPADILRRLIDRQTFFLEITPLTPSVEYEVGPTPTVLAVFPINAEGKLQLDKQQKIMPSPAPGHPGNFALPQFLSRTNRYGFQIVGSSQGSGSVAVYRFSHVPVPANSRGTVDFRFRAGIERGGDFDASQTWSNVSLQVLNRKTSKPSNEIVFHPETNRDCPVPVPAEFVSGGDFDVYVRGMENGQWVGLTRSSVQFISAEHSFAFNLVKSLLILWLMSVLLVIIAVFTSTFLSWPIAVVLTLVILLGHWGVEQLGDALNPGVGRSVATDLGFRDAANTKVVSASVDALAKLLSTVGSVLPDLNRFPVMDDITRGINIPPRAIADGLGVIACYGLPMLVLSFIILKNKEVAP